MFCGRPVPARISPLGLSSLLELHDVRDGRREPAPVGGFCFELLCGPGASANRTSRGGCSRWASTRRVIQPSCSSLCKAGYSEPSLTCRTSPDTCLRRWPMAQPLSGSSARIFRSSRSRVPWTRSDGLLTCTSLGYRGKDIHRLPSVSKRKMWTPQSSIRPHSAIWVADHQKKWTLQHILCTRESHQYSRILASFAGQSAPSTRLHGGTCMKSSVRSTAVLGSVFLTCVFAVHAQEPKATAAPGTICSSRRSW